MIGTKTLRSGLSVRPTLLACPKMKKFVVEVVRSIGADDEIMKCVDIEEDSLRKARLKARLLLAPWREFGATSTRLRGDEEKNPRAR
jgi:hypothetical protein